MSQPERSCVVCRCKSDKKTLDRYVWSKEGPLLDELKILPGRGAYCCESEKCVQKFLSQEQKWRKIFRK